MKRRVDVLVVEDSAPDRLALEKALSGCQEADFHVTGAGSVAQCRDALAARGADIILLDLGLPDSCGLSTFKQVRTIAGIRPIIVVTGNDNHQLALDSLNLGAEDYIVQGDFDRRSLSRSVLYAIERKRTRSSQEVQFKTAQILSEADNKEVAVSRILNLVCRLLGWRRGYFWYADGKVIQVEPAGDDPDTCTAVSEETAFEVAQLADNIGCMPEISRSAADSCPVENLGGAWSAANGNVLLPILSKNKLFGVMVLSARYLGVIDEDTKNLVESVGLQVAHFLVRSLAQESQACLAAIVSSSTDAILSKDLEGVITSWNKGCESLYGYGAAEAVGRHISLLIPPQQRSQISDFTARVKQGETIEEQETTRIRKNGESVEVVLTLSPVKDPGGKLIGISSISRALSDHRRQQRIEFACTKSIMQNAPVGIACLDPDLQVTCANQSLAAMFGMDEGILQGMNVFELCAALPRRKVLKAVRSNEPFSLERSRFCPDVPGFYDITLWPVRENASLAGAVLLAVDVTSAVQLEAERGKFVASVAHDIRNPLIGTQRLLGLLSHAADQQKLIELIKESNENLLSLVQNMVDFYKYGHLAIPPHFEAVNLEHLARTCAELLSEYAAMKNVILSVSAPECVDVDADSIGMRRILTNLLHNAIKFSPVGGRVGVQIEQSAARTRLHVLDSGPGVVPEERDKLFRRFSQSPSGRAAATGSGLGLLLCDAIVKSHSGSLDYEDAPEGGAKFIVTIPTRRRLKAQ